MTDLHFQSLSCIVAAVRNGSLSAVEVTAHHLARIAALEPRLHAFIHLEPEAALAEARALDARQARGEPLGPLHGAPVAVKDLCAIAGTPTRAGGLFPTGFDNDEDAGVVARLRAAGAVIIGKTHLTEGAWGTHHSAFPQPVNPWVAERWTGSSSSGSGVAVAAGMAAAAIGTDTAGSIRFPSACNGLVGLKPTWGRVSRAGVFPLGPTFDHVGPMARTVADVALLFTAIAGPDSRDPTSLEAPPFAEAPPAGMAGLRIGIDRDDLAEVIDAETSASLVEALDLLVAAGATLVDITMPAVDDMLVPVTLAVFAEAALSHRHSYPAQAELYDPDFRMLLDIGRSASPLDLAAAAIWRRDHAGRMHRLFDEVDLIAMPILRGPPPVLSRSGGRSAGSPLDSAGLLRFTVPINAAGLPSLTLPMRRLPDGMPLGFQLVGPAWSEALLLRAGAAYEAVAPYADEHPSL